MLRDLRIPRRIFAALWTDQEDGVTTVEYAVMLVLIAIGVTLFGAGLSGSVTDVFSRLISALGQAS